MKKLFLACLLPAFLWASEISGTIKNSLGQDRLEGAIVKLVRMGDDEVIRTVLTDEKGAYFIDNVPAGLYQLEASKPDFYKNILFDFQVEADRSYECNIDLLETSDHRHRGKGRRQHGRGKHEDSDYCFMIGSIEVRSHGEELIPEDAVTTRKISSGEIEHMQATNLGDVLNLIPGIEKSQNPGLSTRSNVGLRALTVAGTEGLYDSYGTSIIVDGNELSTAASLGTGGRGGVDLRTIPADNIESVEVISGIPGAEYGNFSNGLIKVKTKSGYLVNKVKGKLNPDTKTASYSGGHKFSKSFIDYHFNYGFSERDLRKDGDEYHRLYGKLAYNKPFLNEKLTTQTALTFTKILDSDEPIGVYDLRDYSEGYKTAGILNMDYEVSENEKFAGIFSLNINRRKDFNEKFVAEQVHIPAGVKIDYQGSTLTDTTLSGYIGKYNILGYELNFNSSIKYNKRIELNQSDHNLTTGFESKYETNLGDGLVLDEYWNFYGFNSSRKSYSFDEYDGLQQYSLFAQDVMSGRLLDRKYNLMLGLRYTVFNPQGFDFSKGVFDDQNGEFLSPRFNFQYFISDDLRFRMGAGQSVKSTSLGYMYKDPAYFKYVNKDSVYVEEKHLQENPTLQSYTTDKYEASIDWQPVKALGLSLTGYYMNLDNRPSTRSYPFGYETNPDTINEPSYSIYENLGWKDTWGVEFMLRTKRIKNLQFKMNITYRYSETGKRKTTYDSRPNADYGETPWFKTSTEWREKLIIDYQLNYVSQRLGAWITLDVQHIPLEHEQDEYQSVSYYRTINNEEYLFYQGMYDWWDSKLFDYSNRWLFNLRITKSISRQTELSLYINNLFDDRALWDHPYTDLDKELNPEIYYGLEVSTQW